MAIGYGVAALVLAVAGVAMEDKARKDQIEEQKKIDTLNEANLKAEQGEAVRRVTKSNKKTAGLLRAMAGSSGFSIGGSSSLTAEGIIGDQRSDVEWLKKSGKSRLDIIRSESRARLRLSQAERKSANISGIGSGITSGVSAYSSAGGTF